MSTQPIRLAPFGGGGLEGSSTVALGNGGPGRASKYPCTRETPRAATTRSSSAVSIPSHTARMPSPRQYSRRSEEHTSELQSRLHLVCRLLLEKKKIATAHDCLTSP